MQRLQQANQPDRERRMIASRVLIQMGSKPGANFNGTKHSQPKRWRGSSMKIKKHSKPISHNTSREVKETELQGRKTKLTKRSIARKEPERDMYKNS